MNSNFVKLNSNVRHLFKNIIQKNIIDNPNDNFDYLPARYGPPLRIGGGRVRHNALSSQNPYYPSIEAVEDSNFGGAYGRADHNIRVGSGRRAGIAIMKNRVAPHLIHELDMDYMPTHTIESIHGSGRAPRLTNAIKHHILQTHPELLEHHLAGGKIDWKKIWSGIKSTAGVVGKVASNPITKAFIPQEYHDTLDKTGQVANAVNGMGRRSCKGGNAKQFFQDFGHGFVKGIKGTTKVASKILPVATVFAPELAPLAAASVAANKAMGGRRRKVTKKGHLVKGSQSAKEFMAHIRSLRKK
jgi:hypothetical protein